MATRCGAVTFGQQGGYAEYSLMSAEQRAFRQYCIDLYHAIDAPVELARELLAKGLITSDVRSKVSVRALSIQEKKDILLNALEKRLRDTEAFNTFVKVLQASENGTLGEIGGKLKELRDNEARRPYRRCGQVAQTVSHPCPKPEQTERSSENFSLSSVFRSPTDDVHVQFAIHNRCNERNICFDVKEDISFADVAVGFVTLNQLGHVGNDRMIWKNVRDGTEVVPVHLVVRKNWKKMYIANPKGARGHFTVEAYEMRRS